MHIGNDGTVATTSGFPSPPTATTWLAPQSENHSRPSCHLGDSPNTIPSRTTSGSPIKHPSRPPHANALGLDTRRSLFTGWP